MTENQSIQPRVTHFRRRKGLALVDLRELWHYRDLLVLLATRDVKVRYKQTAIGIFWAVLQPLSVMLMFSIFFGYLGGMGANIQGNIPYPVYTFCALLPWQLFSTGVTSSSNSIVDNQNLISKVYFPRVFVPAATIAATLVDFVFGLLVLICLMAWYGYFPGPGVLLVPVLALFAAMTALSVGVWLAALTAIYRDFRYTTGFLVQVLLFLSPVGYPASIVPEKYRLIYALNPMTGVIESFRWALLGNTAPPIGPILVSACVVVLLLATGMIYFRSVERTMADWV